jgi:hypothetical protein
VADAAGRASFDIRVLIEAADARKFFAEASDQETFMGLIEPVRSSFPIVQQSIHELKALAFRFGAKHLDAGW